MAPMRLYVRSLKVERTGHLSPPPLGLGRGTTRDQNQGGPSHCAEAALKESQLAAEVAATMGIYRTAAVVV